MKFKITYTIKKELYPIYIFLYILISALNSSWTIEYFVIPNFVFMLILLLMSIEGFLRYNKLDVRFVLYVIGMGIGFLVYLTSKSLVVLSTMAFCYASINRDYNKVLKIFEYSIFVAIIMITVLNAIGVLPQYEYTRMDAGQAIPMTRYAFGFVHPNTFSAFLFAFNLCFMLRRERVLKKLAIELFSTFIIYSYCKSYTTTIMMLSIVLYHLFGIVMRSVPRLTRKIGNIYKWTIYIGFPILFVGIIYISFRTGINDFLMELSSTVNGRLFYANQALHQYGVTMIGQFIETYGTVYFIQHPDSTFPYFTVDLLYVYLLVRDGIIATLFFWGLFMSSIKKAIIANYMKYIFAVSILMIYSFLETGMASAEFLFVFCICSADITKCTGIGKRKYYANLMKKGH